MGKSIQMKTNEGEKIYPYPYYPVGSIYLSVNDTNPTDLFGGTWVQIKDKFLLACGSTYSNGATGGEATHRLTAKELPTHNHLYGYSVKTYYGSGSTGVYVIENDHASGNQPANYIWEQGGGGDQPHNNMPPYIAVYMWYRTA